MEVTAAVAVILGIVFLVQPFLPVGYISSTRPWNILISWLFHASFKHYFYNMVSFLFFGVVAEKEMGKFYLPFMLAAALASGFAASLFYPSFLGFSGVIYALIGYLVVVRPFMMTIGLGAPFPLIVSAMLWFLQDWFGLIYSLGNVGHAAHLAGLASGILAGILQKLLIHVEPSAGEVEGAEPAAAGEDREEL